MRYRSLLFVSVLIAGFAFAAHSTQAVFNPGWILSDGEYTDTSYTVTDVQNFLLRRGGALATKTFTTSGTEKNAAQIIIDSARLYGVSPKVLLVTLQKEQSLLTRKDSSPVDFQNALDCAMGYEWGNGCTWMFANKPGAKGFANQVDAGAWQFRQYFYNPLNYHFRAGGTYTVQGTQVIMGNQATASLYNFTPYLQTSFYNFYTAWFSKVYPDGTLLRAGNSGGVWLIQYGQKRAFQNRAAFLTRFGDFSKVISTSSDIIDAYPRGMDIALPNYSLVQTPSGATYLLSGDEKRLIASAEVFRNLGFNPDEVVKVSAEDVAPYLDGVTISNADAYPAGALVKIRENGGIVWIEQGIWYPILDRSILQSRFPNRKITITITLSELNLYVKGNALKLRDGELVRLQNSGGVFVLSNGQRLPITSRTLFDKLGYKMKNVITISPRVAELHPLGPAVNALTN